MENVELFFISSPFLGHAGPALELARLMVNRFHDLTITVLVMKLPTDTNSLSSFGDNHDDQIKFIHFPPMDLDLFADCQTPGFMADAVIERHKPIIT